MNKLDLKIHDVTIASPVGLVQLLASDAGLRGVFFLSGKDGVAKATTAGIQSAEQIDQPVLREAARQMSEYFQGLRKVFDVPLDLAGGTDFQRRVWRRLSEIPYGETISYLEQATSMGMAAGVRAVAAANGRNPVAIFVPCHRVVSSQGHLHGFAGGLAAKKILLQVEGVEIDGYDIVDWRSGLAVRRGAQPLRLV